jgi:hypothetical protein
MDYESAALTIELRAQTVKINNLRRLFETAVFYCGGNCGYFQPFSRPPLDAGIISAPATRYFMELRSSSRSNERAKPSGVRWMYFSETVTLLWPAILMILNTSARLHPGGSAWRAQRVEHELPWKLQRLAHKRMLMVQGGPKYREFWILAGEQPCRIRMHPSFAWTAGRRDTSDQSSPTASLPAVRFRESRSRRPSTVVRASPDMSVRVCG